jgi:hypothetical protein
VALVVALSAVAALSSPARRTAATKCGLAVLDDWYDNGRIDKIYPLNCYEEARDAIPNSIGPYVNAEDVITRALQSALRGKLDPGGCDPTADGSANDCARQPGGGSNGDGSSGTGGSGNGGSNGGTDPGSDDPGQVAPDVDTTSMSSVPIPLLVLGGMSILLLGAGGPGLPLAAPPGGARRRRRRRPTRVARGGQNGRTGTMRRSCGLEFPCKLRINSPSGPLPTIPCPLV